MTPAFTTAARRLLLRQCRRRLRAGLASAPGQTHRAFCTAGLEFVQSPQDAGVINFQLGQPGPELLAPAMALFRARQHSAEFVD